MKALSNRTIFAKHALLQNARDQDAILLLAVEG